MKTFKVPFLASSVIHWMNYVSAVGRNYIINESTIKIPVTEYLEVTGISPELEFGHPSFKQRRMDLKFKDSYANIDYAVEFKYVKGDSTRDLAERKRVFNDLMRLHFFLDTDRKGYFLICGIQEDFKLSFENLDLTPGYVSPKSKTATRGPLALSPIISRTSLREASQTQSPSTCFAFSIIGFARSFAADSFAA